MSRNPIAIIGISALFPGSPTVTTFWRNIVAAEDLTTEVPETHWLASDYYDADPKTPDRTYCRRGAFLPAVPFNPLAFGIPPSIIPATDTSQLLSLMLADRVLKDAGGAERMNRERVGVILGVAGTTELTAHMSGRMAHGQWANGLRKQGFSEEQIEAACAQIADEFVPWQESTFPGLLGNVVAGRIANRFDLGGTNCVVDAACAGSLAAVSMAINELQLGQADLVIAGGVDTLNDPLMFLCFSKTPALSPTGDCRPFSDAADGTILGEGIAMFALKRLADAERDGDHIYAVIAGLGSSSDGRAKSVYAPRPDGQARALRRAYEAAEFSPRTVELIEAHGTATRVGDRAEFEGLRTVFSEAANESDPTNWCALGSVKSQIGHTKAAAGSAGMFKAVMALHHKMLPPTAKVERPLPEMKIESSPFYLNTELRPWIRNDEHPRRAGVSSFGFGGSNFHVALEEYTGTGSRPAKCRTTPSELFVLTADSTSSLQQSVEALAEAANAASSREAFQSLAFRTQQEFDGALSLRLAVVADDGMQAAEKLRKAKTLIADSKMPINDASGIYCQSNDKSAKRIGYLFPGQGSQYLGMGSDLALNFAAARSPWDHAAGQLPLHDVAFPPTAFSDEARNAQRQRLQSTEWAQPAIGVCSLSYLQLLSAAGVSPDCLAGHSFGELTALCAAGVLEEEAFVKLARRRGEIMNDTVTTPGGMLAVLLTDETRSALEKPLPTGLVVANYNSPRQIVISGELDALQKFEKSLTEQRVTFQRLPVAHAFHSPQMTKASETFRDLLQSENFLKSQRPVFCNVDAEPHDDPKTIRALLSRQLREPVRFQEIVERMYDKGVRVFVEVGPQDVLTRLVDQCLAGRPYRAVSVSRRGANGVTQFWHALAQLFVEGVSLDFTKLWDEVPADKGPDAPGPHDILICGSNYGKPYPANTCAQQPGAPSKLHEPKPRAAVLAPRAAVTELPNLNSDRLPEPPVQLPPPPTFNTPSSMSHTLPEFSQSFDEISRQTAAAHQTFLQAMSASHQAFLQAMQQSVVPSDMPSQMSPVMSPSVTNTRIETPTWSAPRPAPTPPARTELPQSFVTQSIEPAQPAQSSHVESKPASVDYGRLLLEVVAEKTGYPAEVLELDMQMESDLGIDSIKRVEILSALVERIPAFAEVETSQIGGLRSLREVLELIDRSIPNSQLTDIIEPEGVHPRTISPVKERTRSGSPDKSDHRQTLLAVVAEKTGYPAEVLELDMQLESDLGIDSIKRVEILSTLVERIPELADIETSQIGGLRTLREILEMIQQSSPMPASAPASTPAVTATRAPGPASASHSSGDLAKVLLAVVAEKTGYPSDVLELDMEIEAGLGIDSIKRVEILSALVERVPQLNDMDSSLVGGLRTLADILRVIQEHVSGSGSAPVSPAKREAASLAGAQTAVNRFPVLLVDAPPGCFAVSALDATQELLLLVQNSKGIASKVATELQRRLVDQHIAVRVVSTLPENARQVICLDGLTNIANPEQALDVVRSAFRTARTMSRIGAAENRLLVTVQNTGGRLGADGCQGPQVYLSGLSGLIKTLAHEWPGASVKAIDLETAGLTAEQLADRLLDELLFASPEVEIGLSADGCRSTLRCATAAEITSPYGSEKNLAPSLKDRAVVVVSGGARGVTPQALRELAASVRCRFVLLGRTALESEPAWACGIERSAELKQARLSVRGAGRPVLSEVERDVQRVLTQREVRSNIAALERAGSEVRYLDVDLLDTKRLQSALQNVRKEWGPISGLIHAAGVLADRRVEDKTDEQFDSVLRTKVEGLRHLLDATRDDPLTLIALFSSVAARFGNAGQCDYAAANEILNKVAASEQRRRGQTCLVKSLNWGPWDGGMVTPGLKALFAQRGVSLIPIEGGGRAFAEELLHPRDRYPEVVIVAGEVSESLGNSAATKTTLDLRVNRSRYPFLDSHRIENVPVVPVVLAMEWFYRAAQTLNPGRSVTSIRELKVLKGILLHDFDHGQNLRITAQPVDESTLQLELTDARGMKYYRCIAELSGELGQSPPQLNWSRLKNGQTWPWSIDKVYEKLFHGPDFQVLKSLDALGDEGGAATLHSKGQPTWPHGPWHTLPSLLDGALQLAILWGVQRSGKTSIPMSVGTYRGFDLPANAPLSCEVRVRQQSRHANHFDIRILSESDDVVAELENVEMVLHLDARDGRA